MSVKSAAEKPGQKKIEYVLFDFHSIQTGHLTENSKPAAI